MKSINTFIKDLIIIEPTVYNDNRGWFSETYNKELFNSMGLSFDFVQDNHSFNLQKGIIRGLHFQNNPKPQTKLVRCTKGSIWDVAVDLRKNSQTYLSWFGINLTSENHKMLLIPQGFAHGFITLESNTEVQYKVDNLFDPKLDRSIRFDDPKISVEWPYMDYILSEKDKNAPLIENSDVNFL